MTETPKGSSLSACAFAAGICAIAIVNLALGTLDPTQPLPQWFPSRTVFAYVASGFTFLVGATLPWRRVGAWSAAALSVYYAVIVALIMNGRVIVAHPTQYGAYFGAVESLALASAGVIVFAKCADIDTALARRLVRLGQYVFGACVLFFGGAHFVYPGNTIPLVPKWLAPSQAFWAYTTGVCQIAAALAVLTKVKARLAAILLTMMYAAFTPLVHLPLLLSDRANPFFWTENALNLALTGVAWVIADSLAGTVRAAAHSDRK